LAVRIRLRRMGKKKSPFYRVVVTDIRSPRDGRFIEIIGTYDPRQNPAEIAIEEEKALYWLGKGATPSDTVRSLLSKIGIMKKFDEERSASGS
jgi:small subunit ribosomal protein S16